MAMLNLEQLATFRLVIARGSFSAAAEQLGLSQPAVSQQVRQLEHFFQSRLVERSGRGVKATAAGQSLLAHSEQIDDAIAAACQAVASHAQEISGTITLGTGATACIHLLPPLLQRLHQTYPLLNIVVTTGNTRQVVSAVEDNRLDIGLVTLPAQGKNVALTPLIQDEMVAIFAAHNGAPLAEADASYLQHLPMIVFESGSSTRELIDQWFTLAGERINPIMALGNIEAIKQMVRAGLGYSIVPRMSVSAAAQQAGLTVCSLQPPLNRTLGTVMRQDKPLTRGMLKLLAALSEPQPKELNSSCLSLIR
ncbi:LysR family transcriptional regulator [Erwinia sp. V71]|uniref:LysR family transcriptional regulator n=1 Tax=Erwinia sp. V71 TaxID=3369424 RepID=UPI003F5F58C3